MKLFANVKNFFADESGAVTVDWVVLTAAIVGLGIAVMASVSNGLQDVSGKIETQLTGTTITSSFEDSGDASGDADPAPAAD